MRYSSRGRLLGEIYDVTALAHNTLDVYYNARGASSFSGQVSFAGAVPEPATWGLMIMGIGFVGFAMRKRQNVNAKINFA